MAAIVKKCALFSVLLMTAFTGIYQFYSNAVVLALAVTAGTTAYHFCMRLVVGTVVNQLPGNWRDWHHFWYQPCVFEAPLYRFLRVKKWKKHMPTYVPEQFDLKTHSADALLQAGCQAEVVHEVIMVCSFFPLFFIRFFGAAPVFILTSAAAALFDSTFVIIQRFNRPRLVRLLEHWQRRQAVERKNMQ